MLVTGRPCSASELTVWFDFQNQDGSKHRQLTSPAAPPCLCRAVGDIAGYELWSKAFAFHCLPHSSARSWLQGEQRFKGLCGQGPLHSCHSFLPAA